MFGLIPYTFDEFRRIDSLFNDVFEKRPSAIKVDIKETEKEYLLEAELPGFKKENITLEYKDNYLTLSAKKEEIIDNSKGNYIRKERSCGKVSRTFYIENLDKDNIKARYKNGILQVILPKAEEIIDESSIIEIE
ncbi:MAG: Hsp20/alpha crystallin family protein [Clostridiales bacterium]|nr:Hsp20/alpha crystallin family protein [Clostridiales bacterium]